MDNHKKDEKELADLKRRHEEWLERYIDRVADFLVELWIWRREHEAGKTDESGSIPKGQ